MTKNKTMISICTSILLGISLTVPAMAGQIRSGFDSNTLRANDDGSTQKIPLGFPINFFGINYTGAYVNNNGNLTFDSPLSTYTPNPLSSAGLVIIAPFWGDVDTRGNGSSLVKYGTGTVDGHLAFGASWPSVGVGYYNQRVDKLNIFQVILIDRSDIRAGDFDIEFNYKQVQWETGDASGGSNGLGGSSVRVGYSNGSTVNFELPGSAVNGTLIDGGANALIDNSLNSNVRGRYRFSVRDNRVSNSLQFSKTNYRVNENDATVTISVSRGGSNGNVSVDYSTSDGTATAGSDYTPVTGTLSWSDGDTANKTFTINIINDNLSEGNETLNLTLRNASADASIGTPNPAVVTIIDDDSTLVNLVQSSFTATASNGVINLKWETATEIDNAGLFVWRGQLKNGISKCVIADVYTEVKRITPLLPAQGKNSAGASYSYQDTQVKSGNSYCYALEDLDLMGKSTFHLDYLPSVIVE